MARRALQAQPTWRSVILADASGRRVAHTDFPRGAQLPPNPEPATLHEVVRTGQPQFGGLAKGPAGHAFSVRAPLMQKGQVRYVLSAIITPEPMLAILRRQNIPGDWVISIFDAAGIRVARSRDHEQFVGRPPTETLLGMIAAGGAEGMGMRNGIDGEPIFTAYARSPDTGWMVAVALPQTIVSSPARRSSAIYAVALALSILAGLGMAFLVSRRINAQMSRLRDGAALLGSGGEPQSEPTGLAEIDEVAGAMISAARQRRSAEAERELLLHREQSARKEAEAANQAKDQFLAMLGHELRNPLAAISNAVGLLDMAGANERVTARSREIIKRQVSNLSRLTDDLLDAARAVLGKIELRPEPVDLTTACVGGSALLAVEDTGIGMPPDLAARVFELFVQGERDLDRSQGGLAWGSRWCAASPSSTAAARWCTARARAAAAASW